MSNIQVVPKISTNTLKTNPGQVKGGNEKAFIMRVFGIASGVKMTEKDGNQLFGLTGQFKAISAREPNVEYQSGTLYLPGGINEMVLDAVDSGELDDKDRHVYNTVEFGFDIFAVPANNPAGYSYEARPVVEARDNDPLAELASKMPDMPSLPAPAEKADKK